MRYTLKPPRRHAKSTDAAYLGDRFGRNLPLALGAAALMCSMLIVPTLGAGAFGLATAMFMGAWMFTAPFYLSTLSAADLTGRVVAFSMSVQFLGLAIGPLLGPRIIGAAGTFAPIWSGIALTGLAISLGLAANWIDARRTPASP